MATKDILTLLFAGVALLISVISAGTAIYAAYKQRTEGERQFRERVTDIAVALIDSGLKIDRLDSIPPEYRNQDYWYDRGTETQRTAALVRQADRLITPKTRKWLTDVDYLTVAQAFARVGDTSHADHYYDLTLRASQDGFYAATNRRLFAWYLFTTGRVTEGRDEYRQAVDNATRSFTDPDQRHGQVGWIYEEWMQTEARFHFETKAQSLQQKARAEYEAMSEARGRDDYLTGLQRTIESLTEPPSTVPPPGSTNPASAVAGPPFDPGPVPSGPDTHT